MKPILFLFALTWLSSPAYSQLSSIWKGNTPGHNREWNYAANWSAQQVPDEFTDVIIPVDNSYTNNYPVIRSQAVEINSICIWKGGWLTITDGELVINNEEGASILARDQIRGNGKLKFRESTMRYAKRDDHE